MCQSVGCAPTLACMPRARILTADSEQLQQMETTPVIEVPKSELTARLQTYFETIPDVPSQYVHLLDTLYGVTDAAYLAFKVNDGDMIINRHDPHISVDVETNPLDTLLDDIGVPYVVMQHEWDGDSDEIRRYYIAGNHGLLDAFSFPQSLDHEQIGEFLGYPALDVQWFVGQHDRQNTWLEQNIRELLTGIAAARCGGPVWRTYPRRVKAQPTVSSVQDKRERAHERWERTKTYASLFEGVDSNDLRDSDVPRHPLYWSGVVVGKIGQWGKALISRG